MKNDRVVCRVCKQVVKLQRKPKSYIDFPVSHINPKTNDTCHGFFVEALPYNGDNNE